jgi:hypothetical protein
VPVPTPAPGLGAAVRRRADYEAAPAAAEAATPLARPAEPASPTAAADSSVDVTDLAERVYEQLVRRLAFEREARGEWQ